MYINKTLRKLIISAAVASNLVFAPEINTDFITLTSVAHAEIKEYTGVGESVISTRETLEIGQQGAKLQAERDAIEKAGVFISSISQVKNNRLEKDEIITLANGIIKIVDTSYQLLTLNDKLGTAKYRATVIVQIDTDDLNKKISDWLKRDGEERSNLTEQNKMLLQTVADLKKRNAELEQLVAKAKTPKDEEKIQTEIKSMNDDTLYAQKIEDANMWIAQRNYKEAIKLFNEAIELKPNEAQAYYGRGRAYKSNDAGKAIEDLTKALELNPKLVEAYNARSDCYYKLKDYEHALADCNKTIEFKPNFLNAYYRRSFVYYKLKDYNKALNDMSKAIEIKLGYNKYNWLQEQPYLTNMYCNRGYIYINLQEYEKAIADFNKTLELDPMYRSALDGLNHAYQKSNNANAAIENYTKIIELEPSNWIVYEYRAEAYFKINEYDKVIADCTKSLELSTSSYIYRYKFYGLRAESYYKLKDYNNAISDYTKAIERLNECDEFSIKTFFDSKNQFEQILALYYNKRGLAYQAASDNEKAEADFAKAKELGYKE